MISKDGVTYGYVALVLAAGIVGIGMGIRESLKSREPEAPAPRPEINRKAKEGPKADRDEDGGLRICVMCSGPRYDLGTGQIRIGPRVGPEIGFGF